jgi:hypothetical protein
MEESHGQQGSALVDRLVRRRESTRRRLDVLTFRWRYAAAALVVGAVVGGVGAFFDSSVTAQWKWLGVPVGAVSGLALYVAFVTMLRDVVRTQLRQLDRDLATAGVETLQEGLEEDFFTKLVKINFKYIDQYYLQTQSQADKSFTLCAAVAVAGFLVVGTGVVLMFRGQIQPAYLTAASGVLTEFVAAVFFYLYNRTILKMSEYHRKLVLTQNISVALKIAEGLPEPDRTRVQEQLVLRLSENVNALLVGDAPPGA